MNRTLHLLAPAVLACIFSVTSQSQGQQTYRLYQGLTAYVNNPDGRDFDVYLDVRDLNLHAGGPRELLVKIYDPSGKPVVRQIIPDDGVASPNFTDPVGGWDHELQYYANLYAKGTKPTIRWSAWSDPNRLKTLVPRQFKYSIKGGGKGIYRIMLAGERDHFVTLKLSPDLKYGIAGHHTWIHGHGDLLKKRYIYVPKNTSGIFFAVAEPDRPRSRTFKLSGPDGKVLFEGQANGSYRQAPIQFPKGQYEGKLLTFEVSGGGNDHLVKVTLQQPKTGAFADYCGMGSLAIYAPDRETALAIKGGTIVEDDLIFWHPFQARFHRWLKEHPLDANDNEKGIREDLERIFNGMRLFETSDGRGSAGWTNWGYAFGYYGCKIWKTAWRLMPRQDVPSDVKDIIREGLIMGGDRLSFAIGMESVNGNAFSQINIALWYCHLASGDALQKQRFETFWHRWKNGKWGPGTGLSPSGDSQEHFAHDGHYGSYLMNNWAATGNTWIVEGGILGDAKDDPRFAEVANRYHKLYSYLLCLETSGRSIAANPWSCRTHQTGGMHWRGNHKWKGEPGPDFTVNVNGGSEWFAARRKGYYAVTFHGRLSPEWMTRSFHGQLGFSGGVLCQLTVPGKGPVLASTLHASYGKGMHPSKWRKFHLHSLVGERWDGAPVIAAISEHFNARLEGNTVTSSGEVRDGHVKSSRTYTYEPDRIKCSVQLDQSDFAGVLSIWSGKRKWAEMKTAYEMIPFMPKQTDNKTSTAVTVGGADLTAEGVMAETVRIDRGGFGVVIKLDKERKILPGNATVMIELAGGDKLTSASNIGISYELIPFGH
ncbi:MAG: hypothetical protein QGG53_32975 [Planctomycetota bacterium]|jgi:hypothetical protein|nr:hypothetical protein [Planctomycetota bacterium]